MLGEVIREARVRKGLKQFELARSAGIAVSTLCDIEKGRIKPSIKTLEKLAFALGTDPSSLLRPQYVNNESSNIPRASGE
jgi:transcriptional regulator with XRE-family HTH domain